MAGLLFSDIQGFGVTKQLITSTSVESNFAVPTDRLFWLIGFAYASFMALLMQKALLPLFPDLHAGHGLLKNDAIMFHNRAVEIAQKIQDTGWSSWSIYPAEASANVGLLSAIYALLGPDPAWFIPFNAAAHATGALLIYRIGKRLVHGDLGKLGGLLAAICFLVFPSALQWYGQNHKDAFAIAGILLTLDAWLAMHDNFSQVQFRNILKLLLTALLGATLLGLFRPYYVAVMVLGFSASFGISSIWRSKIGVIAARLLFIVLLAMQAVVFAGQGTAVHVAVFASQSTEVGTLSDGAPIAPNHFQWKESDYVPAVLDRTLRRASELRAHFAHYGELVGAGSGIDVDWLPDSTWEAISYLPRALVVGLLAPFPDTWSERVTLPRMVGAMETAIWYLAFFGGVVLVGRHRSRKLLAGAVFCAALITMLAYVHPNIGTLYRQRFGLWHFFMLTGLIGWVSLFRKHLVSHSLSHRTVEHTSGLQERNTGVFSLENNLMGSGAIVVSITLASYLGFFARDLLLTGQFGLSRDLDAFFSAAMIPMFFVSSLAMPLGDALILPFVEAGRRPLHERVRLLRGTLGFALLLLVSTMCFVLIGAPWLVSLVLHTASMESQVMAVSMLRWFAPIITLSAWTVIGNAVLNSLGKPHVSALSQLAVPSATLIAFVLAPSDQIMALVIGGMLLGTFINAGIVFWRLWVEDLILLPGNALFSTTTEVRRLYWPLVAAASLPAALVPMNYAFAASVTSGSIAAWALSSKIVILFSGLASVGATAVVLPQMAHRFMLYGEGRHASQDANFLIAVGVWMGGVLMLGGFLFAEPLVAGLFGIKLSTQQISDLANIVKVGFMQIPIVIVGALANKLAIASRRNSRVMYAAMLAFAANFLINLVLVPKLGVMGVAIGFLIGGVFSVLVVLAGVYRQIGLSKREIIIVIVGWLAWVAVCLGLQSTSVAGLFSALLALVIVARLQWKVLQETSPRKSEDAKPAS